MYRKSTLVVGALVTILVLVASPLQARTLSYGGIGAPAASFYTQNAHAPGAPRVGVAYYKVDNRRVGRVSTFHVVMDGKSRLTGAQIKRLVMGRELPADAVQVQGWKYFQFWHGYCAIFKSRWLGSVLYGPYAVLYVSPARQTAVATVSTAPKCRG